MRREREGKTERGVEGGEGEREIGNDRERDTNSEGGERRGRGVE